MANELLAMASKKQLANIDQKLYLEVFAPPDFSRKPKAAKA